MAGDPAPISAKERQALEKELVDLRAERDMIAATLTGTDSAGDSADQADELQRATEIEALDARVRQLASRLSQSRTAGPPRTDCVDIGSTVTVRFYDGTAETLHIGSIADGQDWTLATADSPLGSALLGHRVGDTVDFHTPAGNASVVVVSLGDNPDTEG